MNEEDFDKLSWIGMLVVHLRGTMEHMIQTRACEGCVADIDHAIDELRRHDAKEAQAQEA